jgi:ABC-type lipoprotein release transport system permease subunit
MAISMAVITGALVTGDSVRSGLQSLVGLRLGKADISVTAGDRYLTDSLSIRMSATLKIPATAILQLRGSATAGGGALRMPKVEVYGIDQSFREVTGEGTFAPPENEIEAVISDNLAARLDVKVGEQIIIRINKPGPVPIDAPFVSNEENIVSATVTIKAIADKKQVGRFHLQNTQSAPFNIFLSRKYLQKLAGLDGLSNMILLAGSGKITGDQVEVAFAKARTLSDAGLHLEKHPGTGEWILRTPRVFFDDSALKAIESIPSGKSLYFSYFVNEFKIDDRTTPYSFVSTLPGNRIKSGEILINRWLADDLDAKPGDSVTLSYFMVGPLRNLTIEKARFRITGIIAMDDPTCDPLLMPEIPGLSDAGNCRDWESSIPIDLDKIRDKDELYWKQFKGAPKAYINPEEAASLWQNRFGKYTQVRVTAGTDLADIETSILNHLRPSDTGIRIRESRQEGVTAASTGVDFSGLFLGLSFFLIAGGIILTILLIRLGLESRQEQIGILKALGWSERKIGGMHLWENILISIIGSIIGLGITWVYTILIFSALNGVWNDIVLTDTLHPVFKPGTLAVGTAISILLSIGTTWFVVVRFLRHRTADLMHQNKKVKSGRSRKLLKLFTAISGAAAMGLIVYGIVRIQSAGPTIFFSAGTLMLISLILMAIWIFRDKNSESSAITSLGELGRSNLRRNSNRSLSVILLFAIGMFLVISIGANRKVADPAGTGGFLFYLETTVPVPDNLNNPLVRAKYGLESPSEFVQMKILPGDDASCLNLNRVQNPPILGVPKGAFAERFRFVSAASSVPAGIDWTILDQELPDGAIPAVADQTVIQWGLGLKTGDILKYKAENGDTVNIILVGGLANSIFQGNIMISESQFIRHWPSVSGTNIFLVSADPVNAEVVESDIRRVFRDYGTDLKFTADRLAEFNSVENTYLSIFLVMGALAMLLGTIGLAIILVRNLQQRRPEIALLRATGFSRFRILRLIAGEYSVLLFYGTIAGGLSSLVSVIPGFINPSGEISILYLISILAILLLNGFFWILALGWNFVRKPGLVESLRSE